MFVVALRRFLLNNNTPTMSATTATNATPIPMPALAPELNPELPVFGDCRVSVGVDVFPAGLDVEIPVGFEVVVAAVFLKIKPLTWTPPILKASKFWLVNVYMP